MAVNKEQVLAALEGVASPSGTPLPRTGALSDVVAGDSKVFFSISVDAAEVKAWEPVRKRAEEVVRALPGVQSALVALTAERRAGAAPPRPPQGRAMPARGAPRGEALQGVPDVAAIIAVASGKGGVGKSTTAVNLALGLSALGLKVGILDADIYGPSLPKLLAIRERPQTIGGTRLKPITRYGLTVMSIGFLIDEDTAMIWRGPMVISALTQMLREVEWGTLDVMVVDMPPGTGDAQLTMAQQVPLKGAIIVSTPQDLALIDARRGVSMFKRVNVPVLGVIENMSYFLCPHCGTRSDIFGHGGARRGDPLLHNWLERQAEQIITRQAGREGVAMEVRRLLATPASGSSTTIEVAARRLAMSARTLQRARGAEDRDRGMSRGRS